jgi:hypothetical protein
MLVINSMLFILERLALMVDSLSRYYAGHCLLSGGIFNTSTHEASEAGPFFVVT